MLGLAAIHHRDQPLGALDNADWRAAGDAGFAVAADGIEGLDALLGAMDAGYQRKRSSTEGPQAIFGQLHRWLAPRGREDLDPLRTAVRDYVQRHHPVGPADAIFGRPFDRRELHSIRSASLEYKLHPQRLRKILVRKGVLDGSVAGLTDERTTFAAEANREFLEMAVDCKSLAEVETYLGCGRVHARILLEGGFLRPFVSGGGRKGEFDFTRRELDSFMERLSARSVEVGDIEGAFDIPAAAKRANCGAAEILRAILDGRLGWIGRRSGLSGYLSFRVRLAEVKALLHGERPPGITAREAEKALNATTRTVAALIGKGHLETVTTTNPVIIVTEATSQSALG